MANDLTRLSKRVAESATVFAVAGIVCHGSALAQSERLRIELMPVHVEHQNEATGSAAQLQPRLQALDRAFINVRGAMALLGVTSEEYDLVLFESSETLACTMAVAGGQGTQCRHALMGTLSSEQMRDLPLTLGYGERGYPRFRGILLLMVLLVPDDFSWGGTFYGVNSWWSWSGFQPEDLHWSTTSCATWVNNWLLSIAHEAGHCFGLYHGGEWDPNNDGSDNSMDLMSVGAHFYIDRLRPSNKARIRHHFRDLSHDVATTPVIGQSVRGTTMQ